MGEQPHQGIVLDIQDLAPDGLSHLSPEIRRAQLVGINQYPITPPPWHMDHCHDILEMLLVTHGVARHVINNNQILEVGPGQIEIIPAGNRHRFSIEIDTHVCSYGVAIMPEFFRSLSNSLHPDAQALAQRLAQSTNPVPARLISDPTMFLLMKNLIEEMLLLRQEADDIYHARMIQSCSELLALSVMKLLNDTTPKFTEHPSVQGILEVQAWLDQHLAEPVTLEEMAQMANLSPSHFSHLFCKVIGVSPKSYWMSRRLARAAFLLISSNLPITDISLSVGFNDLTNFAHAFAKYAGCNPSEYRKKYQLQFPSTDRICWHEQAPVEGNVDSPLSV